MKYNSTEDTKKHIEQVQDGINQIVVQLSARAREHDKSKLQ